MNNGRYHYSSKASEEATADNCEKSEFARSVDELVADDLGRRPRKKGFVAVLLDNSRVVFLIIFCIVLVISAVYIVNAVKHYIAADGIYGNITDIIDGEGNALQPMYASAPPNATPDYIACQSLSEEDIGNISDEKKDKEFERIKGKLITLKSKYPNLYGWISIPNTDINFPVMQGKDNDFYLSHSYTGKWIAAGSIFVDYRCKKDLKSNFNLVVYGHHMVHGGMFKSLDNFLSEDFFRKNGIFYFYTVDGVYTYQMFSVYATTKDYNYIRTAFLSSELFLDFCNEIQKNSIHKTTDYITLKPTDKIITLSTCTNRLPDGRIAAHAVMVDFHS